MKLKKELIIDLRDTSREEQLLLAQILENNGIMWQSGVKVTSLKLLPGGSSNAVRISRGGQLTRGDITHYKQNYPKESVVKDYKYYFNNKP